MNTTDNMATNRIYKQVYGTIPDKPNSRLQKYRFTALGTELKKKLKNDETK
jgi:hypothetical protein